MAILSLVATSRSSCGLGLRPTRPRPMRQKLQATKLPYFELPPSSLTSSSLTSRLRLTRPRPMGQKLQATKLPLSIERYQRDNEGADNGLEQTMANENHTYKCEQYAYSTHHHDEAPHKLSAMSPASIIYPNGASSTDGDNIQLDISKTFQDFAFDESTGIATVGVSLALGRLTFELKRRRIFVPFGQCTSVNVGGHSHTGGYGVPGRAFGFFGDHIMAITVITANGETKRICRDTTDKDDGDLFWACLGGSPGNFALLTHIELVHHDKDHPKARGMQLTTGYDKDMLTKLLKIKAAMVAEDDLAADHDFCITVMSGGPFQLGLGIGGQVPNAGHGRNYGFESDPTKMKFHADDKGLKGKLKSLLCLLVNFPNVTSKGTIIVFAEWANLGGMDQQFDSKWFDQICLAMYGTTTPSGAQLGPSTITDPDVPGPKEPGGDPLYRNAMKGAMSYLTSLWAFDVEREYKFPYVKRTYVTKEADLDKIGWVEFTANQIDKMLTKTNDRYALPSRSSTVAVPS
eukprot:gene7263-375_t